MNLVLCRIEAIPTTLFIHLTDLLYLDLSHNKLETLPPQTRRLANLQTLNLSHNPLELFQLRQLPSLQHLEVLNMANTQRTLQNFPAFANSLTSLVELDVSQNRLAKVPACLYAMPALRRLNLSDNAIAELSADVEVWQRLEVLNLSRNQLTALPASLCRLTQLRRLYLNDNQLDFDGIPSGIGKLGSLETFSASNNRLEMVPEGLCRCGALKKLNLSSNRLITLPDAIHLLNDLDQLDLRNNPDLIMPPKPTELQKGAGIEFYNIDFSLQHQLRLAGANGGGGGAPGANGPADKADANGAPAKDPLARKQRLRRGLRNADVESDSAKILKGMKDIAKEKDMQAWDGHSGGGGAGDGTKEGLRPKRWDESLEKPPLDYSEIFEEDDGQIPGLTIWEIENFLPNKLDEVVHGKFYEGDCYIVLKTSLDDNGQLTWLIYFWIGVHATLDKKACSAIHAVNLRNYLGALCRTVREEQADESDEFLGLFDTPVTYIEGGRTATGFFTVEDAVYATRMYRVHGAGASIHMEPVAVAGGSLDPRYVFVVDAGDVIRLWYGVRSKNTIKSKARLMVEKINKNERKSRCEIVQEQEGNETAEFWRLLAGEGEEEAVAATATAPPPPAEHVAGDFVPALPRLYQVQLGMGYLELPQVEEQQRQAQQQLQHTLLNSKNVYILDCHLDVFVWFGKKSTRLVRAAAVKLSQELFNMIDRPAGVAHVSRVQEGTESQIFKSKFSGWEEIIAVDFTRTAASVAKTGADLTKWAKQQETRADLAALFMPRQPAMSLEKATQLEEDWNMDLDVMEAFVWEGKKYVRLPDEELGNFYTDACYVFLCRYCIPPEEDEEEEEEDGADDDDAKALKALQSGASKAAADSVDGSSGGLMAAAGRNLTAPAAAAEDEIQCIVYFWQGRQAGNMAWLTFTFTLQKKFKAMFGEELEVVRIHQQQENLKFMAHFKKKFIIRNGRRNERQRTEDGKPPVEFYHLRSNGSALCTRLIQIRPEACALNSAFWWVDAGILVGTFHINRLSAVIFSLCHSRPTTRPSRASCTCGSAPRPARRRPNSSRILPRICSTIRGLAYR